MCAARPHPLTTTTTSPRRPRCPTDTRITDVEVLEARYPVFLRSFSVRRGSGGQGRFPGGDGVRREITVCRDGVVATLLTERRTLRPFGMAGGGSGAPGRNSLRRAGAGLEEKVNIGAKRRLRLAKGDTLIIDTPGGGGWGEAGERASPPEPRTQDVTDMRAVSAAARLSADPNAVEF